MSFVINNRGTNFTFSVDKTGEQLGLQEFGLDHWMITTVSVKNRMVNYHLHGEYLSYKDLLQIRDIMEELLAGRLCERTDFLFDEPDFGFVFYPAPETIFASRAGCERLGVSADFVINYIASDYSYTGECYVLHLSRDRITAWCDYLNEVISVFDPERNQSEKSVYMLSMINSCADFAEIVGWVFRMDFYPDPVSCSPGGNTSQLRFSIPGKAFGGDRDGGEFVFLLDGSIGYRGQDTKCGRIAENLTELFELLLNCADYRRHYSITEFINDPALSGQETAQCVPVGRKGFAGADGNDSGDYDALRQEVVEDLKLKISSDISKDILPRFYRAATREPLHYWEDAVTGQCSEKLIG